MWEIESFAVVRAFIEQGGNVLLVIAFVTAVMWTLIVERFWYFRTGYRRDAWTDTSRTVIWWSARSKPTNKLAGCSTRDSGRTPIMRWRRRNRTVSGRWSALNWWMLVRWKP